MIPPHIEMTVTTAAQLLSAKRRQTQSVSQQVNTVYLQLKSLMLQSFSKFRGVSFKLCLFLSSISHAVENMKML